MCKFRGFKGMYKRTISKPRGNYQGSVLNEYFQREFLLLTCKLFKVKNSFKGMMGIFDIKNNKINHRLNFYKVEDKKLIKIF